ncbi:hypothetical protein FD906_02165 [Acinetobacter baumannii]|uniref:hypothetical protein n=1 Tax=Acinetobacter baumannii TaxID=470 RepID=UPI0010FEF404|nr:hypothetical protein [Acinetobacter baumannii]MDF7839299.1 hypothetical protein [Acinetobacter baumannii]TLT57079.1 hypothetical protein FD906_02165 [Acinetobacter baumannii]
MKTFLIIMTVICIATFMGLVVAAIAAKLHQFSGSLAKFRFSMAFMDITFFFLCSLILISHGSGKLFGWEDLTVFLLILLVNFRCYDKWERKA